MARPKKGAAALSQARPKRAAALRTNTINGAPTIAPDSAAGVSLKRLTRYTRTSKNAVSSPSQLPCELLTTSAPTQLPLPLPLERLTPTPSDLDVGLLVGGDLLHPVQPEALITTTPGNQLHPPLSTIGQDSPCPAQYPLHPSQHTNTRVITPLALSVPDAVSASVAMQLDLKPVPLHDLAGLVSLDEQQPIALLSPIYVGSDASPRSIITVTDSDIAPGSTSIHTIPLESESTNPLTLSPTMEMEVEEWLKTVGGAWVHNQETKHGVPADIWFSRIHHLTRLYPKSSGGLNTWNSFQKWWKHHHQEEERPLGSEEVRRVNTTRIMAEYHTKMEELGTREERDEWCLRVERDLGCSTEERVDGVPPGLLRVRKLENDIMNVIVPAVLSKIYVFAGIIPANPRDPIARAASGFVVNDPLVSQVLNASGTDLKLLFSDLELGVRNRLREQVGEPPLLKGVKVGLSANSKPKATASEVDQFDANTKRSTWCDIELEASEAMVAIIEQAPDPPAGWKHTANRLPDSWWRFAHQLFHRDPSLNELPAERDAIIQTFRKHILSMTHDPVRKNGARALALIDHAIQGPAFTPSRHVRTEWKAWGKKLVDHDNVIGNWPEKAATKLIPIQSSKMGDLLADDYRAILLAVVEENEERRLFVGKRPEGADWLIKRLDGERVPRSVYQREHSVQPYTTAPPQPTPSPMTFLVRAGPLYMMSDGSIVAHQPAASPKRTKPVHRKRKGFLAATSIIPPPNPSVVHMPLDLRPFKDLFNPADDVVSISANGRHFSAPEDVLESSPAKRFKRSEGLLHPELGILSSSDSPMLASSTLSGSLLPATQPMATSTNAHLYGQNTTLGRSAPPSTIPGPLPYPQFPPYGYGMSFPPVPPGMMPGTSNGYPPTHSQMPPPLYHPMMGYYFPPGYGQQPPPPMS